MTPQLRHRVIAEWRGLPQSRPRVDAFTSAGETLGKVMQALGLQDRLHEADVLQAWHQIVGEFIATHSAPHRLRNGILYVRVLQPTVHYELDRVWKPEIVKKLKTRFGSKIIREVRFHVG